MSMLRNVGVVKPLMFIVLGTVHAWHLAQAAMPTIQAASPKLGYLKPADVLAEASANPSNFRVLDEGAIPGAETKTPTYFWNVGEKINIAFIGGDKEAQEFVKKTAAEWLKYANLEFLYVNEAKSSDVRILIGNLYVQSYSYLGIACRKTPKNEPTMILSLPKDASMEVKRWIVLREFGHMLGLPSENENPNNNQHIDFNKLYQVAWQKWHMTKMQVDNDLRPKTETGYIYAGKPFDPDSIMMLRIPPEALIPPVELPTKPHDVLSPGDQEFISSIYPKQSPVVTVAQNLIKSTTNPETKEALKASAAKAEEAEKTQQATKLADALTPEKAAVSSAEPEKVEQRVQESEEYLISVVHDYLKAKERGDPKAAETYGPLFLAAREQSKQRIREKAIYGNDDQYFPQVYEQIFKQSLSIGYLCNGVDRLGTCFMIGKNLVLTCNHCLKIPNAIGDFFDNNTLKVRFGAGVDPASEETYPVKDIVFQGTQGAFDGVSEGSVDYAFLELGPSELDNKLASDKGILPVKIHNDRKLPRDTAVYVIGYPGRKGNKTVADNARIFAGFSNSFETKVSFELEAHEEAVRLSERSKGEPDPQRKLIALDVAKKEGDQMMDNFTKSFKPGAGNNARWYFFSQMVSFPPHAAFALDSDTFHGNSGSPVFTRLTSEVIGVLFRGMDDRMRNIKVGWSQHEEAIPIQVILQNWKDNQPAALAKYGLNFN